MEEVVVDANPLDLEQFRPDTGENALRFGARNIISCWRCRKIWSRKRAAVNLAVGCYRYCIEKNERRRNHLLRQTLCQKLAQLLRPRICAYDIRYQSCLAITLRHHNSIAHVYVLFECRFDLAQLDTIPTHFHLIVFASERFDNAVAPKARKVSRLIKT